MWKLSEIRIENIVSFQEAALTIQQGVATLIFGKNEDNASQPCNGSGKSSLIEAISFALTGEQLRKVKSVEEIINDHAEEAHVYVRLDNSFNGTSLTIERTISRNAPQSIECHKYDADGNEIETDKTIQPTVLDYNKFILNEIGLTKDDIYSNFILCDNKYESFFDCSDKNKKEVINRFSNGIIIDGSIERVQSDMQPVEVELAEANNTVTSIKGSIAAIECELSQANQKSADARKEREARIERLDGQIQKCREDIEAAKTRQRKAQERLQTLKALQREVATLEAGDTPLIDAYEAVRTKCEANDLGVISDFKAKSEEYKQAHSELSNAIVQLVDEVRTSESVVKDCKDKYAEALQTYQVHDDEEAKLSEGDKAQREQFLKEIAAIDDQLDQIERSIKANKSRQAALEALITHQSALLNGAITCPKCSYKFFPDDKLTIEDVEQTLSEMQTELADKGVAIDKLNIQFDQFDEKAAAKSDDVKKIEQKIKERSQSLEGEYAELRKLQTTLGSAEATLVNLQKRLAASETELDRLNGKIEVLRNRLFGEVNGMIDGRIIQGESYVEQQQSAVTFSKGKLNQYQQSKKELIEAPETDFESSLRASWEKYNAELKVAQTKAAEIQCEYDKLKELIVNFTMFKSYIARKKIDALSLIVNDFLEKIESDIQLRLEGFTVTKTGKLRDKISVQVMRDGIDCGSYYKFSGGEKARLNLACILSLHTLTNSNCEDGKGLDFIIIDELLDKSDEMGMATYCEALNKLGQTALLITQGAVSEGYPHKLLITKRQGVSTISN